MPSRYNTRMRSGIAAVAFDLDGTLYPNYRLNIRLIPFFFKEWRLLLAFGKARNILHSGRPDKLAPDNARAGRQPDFYQEQATLTAAVLGRRAENIKDKIETQIYRGWEPHFKKIRLYNCVKQTLETFRAAGLKMGLLSDFPPKTKMEYLGIGGYWDAVLCSEETGVLKPASLPFLKLAQALKTDPAQILYVGNSLKYDVIGAKQAGMQAALINRLCLRKTQPESKGAESGNSGRPDFVFRDYRQLCNYVLS